VSDASPIRRSLADRETYAGLAALFAALADPTRAAIVHVLLQEELTTSELAAGLGISAPAASQHLRVLRDLRLVRVQRQGKRVFYRLDDAHVEQLVNIGLAHENESSGR
jgi:DNA-binding transcriptional ArsR family regulator